MALNFTTEEVFIATSETHGQRYNPTNNTIVFETPTKFLGKSIWAIKFNNSDKNSAVIFPALDATTESKEFGKKQPGQIFEDTTNKKAYLNIIGDENGIEVIQLAIE